MSNPMFQKTSSLDAYKKPQSWYTTGRGPEGRILNSYEYNGIPPNGLPKSLTPSEYYTNIAGPALGQGGGSRKHSRKHSKKQKRVHHTRRKQTRRHRHSRHRR